MMFILPIGLLVFFWDRQNVKQSLALFGDYIVKMQHADFDDEHRMQRIDAMFYENGYKIVVKQNNRLAVEKKHFNVGMLLIMFGLLNYFGIFGYLLYFRFFLKPRRLCVDLTSEVPLSRC